MLQPYLRQIELDLDNPLPKGGVILRNGAADDMDDKLHSTYVVRYRDIECGDMRVSHFDQQTGEYLGETW